MKPKLIIIASYAKSLIHFRLHLMQAFIAKGYDVVALAPDDQAVAKMLNSYDIKFVAIQLARTGLNPVRDIFTIKQLYRILKNERADLVFTYTIKPVIYGSFAAKLCGVKHIYAMITGVGYVFSDYNWKSKMVGKLSQFLFRHTLKFNHKVFFQNPDNLDEFLKKRLIMKKQGVLINGSGVDVSSFSPHPYSQEALTFLMIARLLINKGLHEYLEAAKIMKSQYPELKFLLVGWFDKENPNGILENELKPYVDKHIIEYLGALQDVRSAISRSSVYVLPSYGEGTPRTVLEAMAMGKPIITTEVPGCKETVKHGVNGFLVPAKDVNALVVAMEKFVNNSDLIIKMGEASRELAVSKYDVHQVNASILAEMCEVKRINDQRNITIC